MSTYLSVLRISDLPPGEMKAVDAGGTEVVVANVDGSFFAFSNVCPHEEGPLADGELVGDVVTCPWHFTEFNVRTGEVVDGMTDEPVRTYAVRVEDGHIQIAAD